MIGIITLTYIWVGYERRIFASLSSYQRCALAVPCCCVSPPFSTIGIRSDNITVTLCWRWIASSLFTCRAIVTQPRRAVVEPKNIMCWLMQTYLFISCLLLKHFPNYNGRMTGLIKWSDRARFWSGNILTPINGRVT